MKIVPSSYPSSLVLQQPPYRRSSLLHVLGEKSSAADETIAQELEQTRARLLECQKENDKLRDALQNSNNADTLSSHQGRNSQGGGWGSKSQNSLNKDSRVTQLEQEVTMLEEELVRVREVASIQQQMSSNNRWGNRTTPPPSTDDSRLLMAMQDRERKTKSQLEESRMEIQKRDQEILAMSAKMKTLEEQHQDYQRHIMVLKESLTAKEEHYGMLQADVSAVGTADF
ncbi:hypothetical protein HAZT_HAZT003565 [Hyalella azteca]|uniref:Uncharacterized protein n=1 Tax=Hyalella azteca TaxID=294128 RepID=A0A6A0GVB4_HYAAZ|nr:hypothetical protein HAZT_HAZT003565 [Hyalella azteca]